MRIPTDNELRSEVFHNNNNLNELERILKQSSLQIEPIDLLSSIIRSSIRLSALTSAKEYQKLIDRKIGPWVNKFLESDKPYPKVKNIQNFQAILSPIDLLLHKFNRSRPLNISSSANSAKNIIYMNPAPKYNKEAVLAHEMAHTRQENMEFYTAFIEGHAIGVEREYALEQNDPELNAAYFNYRTAWLIKFKRYEQLKKCAKNISLIDTIMINDLCKHEAQAYSIGNAAFLIAESRYGKSIYADALKEPMLLLDILRKR